MLPCGFLYVFFCLEFIKLNRYVALYFPQIWKMFSYHFLKYFFCTSHLFPPATPITYMLGFFFFFYVVPQVFEALLMFAVYFCFCLCLCFNLYYFYCYNFKLIFSSYSHPRSFSFQMLYFSSLRDLFEIYTYTERETEALVPHTTVQERP